MKNKVLGCRRETYHGWETGCGCESSFGWEKIGDGRPAVGVPRAMDVRRVVGGRRAVGDRQALSRRRRQKIRFQNEHRSEQEKEQERSVGFRKITVIKQCGSKKNQTPFSSLMIKGKRGRIFSFSSKNDIQFNFVANTYLAKCV